MAKFIPYVILLVLGWLLGWFVYRKIQQKTPKRWLQALVFIGFFIQPVIGYFVIFPIYQGDLMDLSYHPKTKLLLPQQKSLIVVALPGCKFCSESTQFMKSVRPFAKTPIKYWVLGSDSTDLKTYQGLVEKGITCALQPNLTEVLPITEGSFPTYLLIEKGKIIKAWHNDTFGVRALQALN